jgi:hypothetical protein
MTTTATAITAPSVIPTPTFNFAMTRMTTSIQRSFAFRLNGGSRPCYPPECRRR